MITSLNVIITITVESILGSGLKPEAEHSDAIGQRQSERERERETRESYRDREREMGEIEEETLTF